MKKEQVDLGIDIERTTKYSSEITIPISIIADRTVATLEAVVEYLKDIRNMSYHEIAELLHRDDRTIWTTYNRVRKKRGVYGK